MLCNLEKSSLMIKRFNGGCDPLRYEQYGHSIVGERKNVTINKYLILLRDIKNLNAQSTLKGKQADRDSHHNRKIFKDLNNLVFVKPEYLRRVYNLKVLNKARR